MPDLGEIREKLGARPTWDSGMLADFQKTWDTLEMLISYLEYREYREWEESMGEDL